MKCFATETDQFQALIEFSQASEGAVAKLVSIFRCIRCEHIYTCIRYENDMYFGQGLVSLLVYFAR